MGFMAKKLPYTPLEDVSGVVVKVGSLVKRFKPVSTLDDPKFLIGLREMRLLFNYQLR